MGSIFPAELVTSNTIATGFSGCCALHTLPAMAIQSILESRIGDRTGSLKEVVRVAQRQRRYFIEAGDLGGSQGELQASKIVIELRWGAYPHDRNHVGLGP